MRDRERERVAPAAGDPCRLPRLFLHRFQSCSRNLEVFAVDITYLTGERAPAGHAWAAVAESKPSPAGAREEAEGEKRREKGNMTAT